MDSLTIRPSDVSAWSLCPKRVELKEMQKVYPSYAMSRGSLIHARIEHHLTPGHTKPQFDWRNEYDVIVQADTNNTVPIDDLPGIAVGRLIGEADAAYASWKNQMLPLLLAYGDDIIVEQRLERELYPDGPLIVGGTPDVVIPEAKWIIDWKSAGAPWKDTKAAGEYQPPAYTWLNGWDEARFTFAVCDMKTYNWQQHTVHVTPEQTYAWVDIAVETAKSMEAGIYPATPNGQSWKGTRGWHCSPKYCAAWNVCDARHLIADGQGTQVRNPKEEWTT